MDETRPRNQGFNLTSWELINENISNTLIVDNVGGHLMQHNKVDLCITGTDRTSSNGDVCNKIGTYLKALAANSSLSLNSLRLSLSWSSKTVLITALSATI